MILFLGDSFTWGQGLEWEYLIDEKNISISEINKIIPPKYNCEQLPIKLQDIRESKRWPRLVAEHFDINYDIGRVGNGGGDSNSIFILRNLEQLIYTKHMDLVVFQFSMTSRDIPNGFFGDIFKERVDEFNEIYKFIRTKYPNIQIVTVSWLPEIGELMEMYFDESISIKIIDGNNIYNSFEPLLERYSLSSKYSGLNDSHFSSEGNLVIANSVINHLEKYKIIEKNKFNLL